MSAEEEEGKKEKKKADMRANSVDIFQLLY